MMTVDDEFLDHYPADKEDGERGKFDEERQLRKGDMLHDRVSKVDGVGPIPIEVHFKSRPKPGLLIGEFAQMAGIRPSAVRYYESVGLLPPPMRQGRWRVYSTSALERLKTLVAARHLGFSIAALKRLLQAEPAELRATARDRAEEIRRSMATMGGAANRLEALAACQCMSEADCVISAGI